jgi:hypothetical protein
MSQRKFVALTFLYNLNLQLKSALVNAGDKFTLV